MKRMIRMRIITVVAVMKMTLMVPRVVMTF